MRNLHEDVCISALLNIIMETNCVLRQVWVEAEEIVNGININININFRTEHNAVEVQK